MKIYQAITEVPQMGASTVTIGNFDGLHLGHQELIDRALETALRTKTRCILLTFEPNPKAFFRGGSGPGTLMSTRQKLGAISELGMPELVLQPFDQAFAGLSREVFLKDYIQGYLAAGELVVGQNFCFGTGRSGDAGYLETQVSETFRVQLIPPVQVFGEPVSSTRIRTLLAESGDMERVAALLGRTYSLWGRTLPGARAGRRIGFPTLNLTPDAQIIPKHGVYCGYVDLQRDDHSSLKQRQQVAPAVFNIGVRPTMGPGSSVQVEAHLLSGPELPDESYDLEVAYYMKARLRDETVFASVDELKVQIGRDCAQARRILGI